MIPPVLPILAADSVVTGIIGDDPVRFYPHGRAPQSVQAPYVSWFVISGNPQNVLDEIPRVDRLDIQVDCWSDNKGTGSQQVQELAKAVRDAIEPYAHMTGIVIDGIDPDTQRYRIGLQFTFWEDRE